jgi:hypothetical protein
MRIPRKLAWLRRTRTLSYHEKFWKVTGVAKADLLILTAVHIVARTLGKGRIITNFTVRVLETFVEVIVLTIPARCVSERIGTRGVAHPQKLGLTERLARRIYLMMGKKWYATKWRGMGLGWLVELIKHLVLAFVVPAVRSLRPNLTRNIHLSHTKLKMTGSWQQTLFPSLDLLLCSQANYLNLFLKKPY